MQAPGQDVPTAATHPDYSTVLKQANFGVSQNTLDDMLDQTLDTALPDNSAIPTLPALKNLVREFMSQRDANGMTMAPTFSLAMSGLVNTIDSNPQLANAALVESTIRVGLHNTEHQDGWVGRSSTLRVLGKIVEKRPDLANTALVKNVTEVAANDPESHVSWQAQNTLARIADQRPDLIDADMVKVISQTAASTIVNPTDYVATGEARSTAQQTLKVIAEKRPDLFGTPKPDGAKGHQQHGATPHVHAARPPPRPAIAP